MTTSILSNPRPKYFKLVSKQFICLWIKAKVKRIQHARMIARQRRALAQLSSTQLRDIGISRYEADVESTRSFWDIPENLK